MPQNNQFGVRQGTIRCCGRRYLALPRSGIRQLINRYIVNVRTIVTIRNVSLARTNQIKAEADPQNDRFASD